MPDISSCSDPVPGTWGSPASIGAREYGGEPFFMLDFAFSTPIYLTGTDRHVFYNSNTYAPFPFNVEPIKNASGPAPVNVRVSAGNLDRSISAAVLAEQVQGKEVTIRRAYWSSPMVHTTPYIYFQGQIDTVTITEDEDTAQVTLEIKNDFVRWDKPIPSNQFSITCNHIFKSNTPGCQYTGAESLCDRTYARCVALNNTTRFRGFRHMSIMEDLEIWWGRTRDSSEA